jgi:hypothetical protein
MGFRLQPENHVPRERELLATLCDARTMNDARKPGTGRCHASSGMRSPFHLRCCRLLALVGDIFLQIKGRVIYQTRAGQI